MLEVKYLESLFQKDRYGWTQSRSKELWNGQIHNANETYNHSLVSATSISISFTILLALHDMHLLTGNTPFEWTSECQEAFDKLKLRITNAPILSIPNSHDKFHLECNTSEYALGAVLSQHKTTNGNLLVWYQKHSHPPSGIMKLMAGNYLQSWYHY